MIKKRTVLFYSYNNLSLIRIVEALSWEIPMTDLAKESKEQVH
jgi:hypothetical protein